MTARSGTRTCTSPSQGIELGHTHWVVQVSDLHRRNTNANADSNRNGNGHGNSYCHGHGDRDGDSYRHNSANTKSDPKSDPTRDGHFAYGQF